MVLLPLPTGRHKCGTDDVIIDNSHAISINEFVVALWLGEAVGKSCRSISGPAWLLRWAVGPITVNYQKILHTEPIFCQILSFKAIKTRIQAHGRNRTYFFKLELYFFETILKGVPGRHKIQHTPRILRMRLRQGWHQAADFMIERKI